jgi:hypothetical protein
MLHEIIHSADDRISSDGAWWILGINAILLIPAIFAMFFYPAEGLMVLGGAGALTVMALIARRRRLIRKPPA